MIQWNDVNAYITCAFPNDPVSRKVANSALKFFIGSRMHNRVNFQPSFGFEFGFTGGTFKFSFIRVHRSDVVSQYSLGFSSVGALVAGEVPDGAMSFGMKS